MKMAKTSISLKRLEVIMHSGNKVNTGNKIFWKILVRITKINLHHCKNDQKII